MKLTEHTFRYKIIEMMNSIIRGAPELFQSFEEAEAEHSLKVGGQSVFLDGLLWADKQRQKFALSFETKQPKYDATDLETVNNALMKANALAVDYFATWNVRDFILWKTHESNVPLMQRQKMIWRNIVLLPDNDLDRLDNEENWAKIRSFLEKFLTTFHHILSEPARFIGVPIDDFFVYKLLFLVDINTPVFASALKITSETDKGFYAKLVRWVSAQGWNSAIENRIGSEHVSYEFYFKIARLAVFQIINKVVFYNVVRNHYPDVLGPIAVNVKTGRQLQHDLNQHFDKVKQIDYQPIFAATVFDEARIPDDAVEQLTRFIKDLNNYNFAGLNYEILGRVYESLIPETDRHEMGQYFTPANRVDLIVGFCVTKAEAIISDWSCGAGTFLVRSYSRLKYLAGQSCSHKQLLEQLWGCDIAKFPSHLAMMNLAMLDLSEKENFPYIQNCDAFDIMPKNGFFQVRKHTGIKYRFEDISGKDTVEVAIPEFDATVGNPPYIRQELIDDKEKLAATLNMEWGVNTAINKQADIYVYFFLHSAAFLKEGGRLGYITSNSWLDVRYGASLQHYLCQHFKIIAIIASPAERDFAAADVNSVITIIERCRDQKERDENTVRFVSLKTRFEDLIPNCPPHKEDDLRWQDVDRLIQRIEQRHSFYEDDQIRVVLVQQKKLYEEGMHGQTYAGSKWGSKYLRAPDIYFKVLEIAGKKDLLVPLGSVANVRFGIKTGDNDFFFLADDVAKAWGIEDEFLVPAVKNARESSLLLIYPAELKYKLLMCHKTKEELLGLNILRYIEEGEARNLHLRPTCSARKKWYDLGKRKAAKINCNFAINEIVRFYYTPGGLYFSNNFYEIHAKSDSSVLLALTNSSVFQLIFNSLGRVNFGGGLLKAEAYEVAKLMIPNPKAFSNDQIKTLKSAIRKLSKRPIESIFHECGLPKAAFADKTKPLPDPQPLPDRKQLDDVIFDALGLTEQECKEIYWEVCRLVYERVHVKPQSVTSKKSKRVENFNADTFAAHVLSELEKIEPRRRFPDDFIHADWPVKTRILPDIREIETPRIEYFFDKAVLVINGHRLECESAGEAEYLKIVLLRHVIGPVPVPQTEAHTRQVCAAYTEHQQRIRHEISQILKLERLTRKQAAEVNAALEKLLQ